MDYDESGESVEHDLIEYSDVLSDGFTKELFSLFLFEINMDIHGNII
jgi:hypothetical protein